MSSTTKESILTEIDKERFERAERITYTSSPNGDCDAFCFRPNQLEDGRKYPAIVYFHGSLFEQRLPSQFAPHCFHFANRGMIAFTVEYRVLSINKTSIMQAMEDAHSFMRYLVKNADYFQVDPSQIVVAGNAGGGFLASYLSSRHKNNTPALAELPRPVANILYAPLTNTTKKGVCADLFPDEKTAKLHSPSEQIEPTYPPTLGFHGKQDQLIPYVHTEKFFKTLKRKKVKSELISFDNGRHVDFNHNVNPSFHEITMRASDGFLTELGIIEPDPDAFLD